MLYYRFRTMSTLAFKELLYDELYFSYPHELNDPLDGMVTFEFGEDFPKWKRLLDYAWKDIEIDTTPIAECFAKNSPVSLSKLTSDDSLLQSLIIQSIDKRKSNLVPILVHMLKIYLLRFVPTEGCSVSLSKSFDNTLMWSHYTGKHEGYCIIFRSINNEIRQCQKRTKKSIAVGAYLAIGMPENFKIRDINYKYSRGSIDTFSLYPWGVYGRVFTDEERIQYHENRPDVYLTKSICWEYEKESRLYIPPASVMISKTHLSSIDRIFHYDSSQIAGVIYGMRMTEDNKKLIRDILLRKSSERSISPRDDAYLFDIATFEAHFDDNKHNISIIPTEIFADGRVIDKSDPKFDEKLVSWTSGEALHIQRTESGISCKRVTLD